jgi:hypothetical protein
MHNRKHKDAREIHAVNGEHYEQGGRLTECQQVATTPGQENE